MIKVVASPFSSTFSKNVLNTQLTSSTSSTQLNNGYINKDNDVVQATITPLDYTLATSVEVSNKDAKNLSGNIDKVTVGSIETLGLSDEWTRNNEKFDSKSSIGLISIEELYNQDSGVIYDSSTKTVTFKDPSLASLVLGCPIAGSDTISLAKLTGDVALIQLVDKINTFGKVYDFQFKSTSFGEYASANTSICSSVANALGYLSFDKLLNDEIIRKNKIDANHLNDPENFPAYSGFLVSKDYIDGGWINIDQLAVNDMGQVDESIALSVRTKKIVEAKRIAIQLLLNFSSSIQELNSENKLVDFGVRVKDIITGQVFDYQNAKNGNVKGVGGQLLMTYTGKIDYGNIETNTKGSFTCNPCDTIIQEKCSKEIIKIANCAASEAIDGTIHEIMPQIRINPLTGIGKAPSDFTNTIDPIHWTTGIQNIPDYKNVFKNLINEWGETEYLVGHLNVPRSFHYASGDANNAYVCGGFFNSVINEKISIYIDNSFLNIRGWNLIGKEDVYYEIATPGGYDYNVTDTFTLYYEETWDGNAWTVKSNTVIPTPKAMGLTGGGKALEEKIIGFGTYDATFLNNGTINTLFPTSQIWVTKNDVWTKLNNANYARVSPAGYLKSETVSSATRETSADMCSVAPIVPKDFFYADSNTSAFPDTTIRIDPNTQLKVVAAMKFLLNDTAKSISTVASSNIGIAFNGWIGAGGNNVSTGLGSPGVSNVNPFGLDKIIDSELTNIFEFMAESKVEFTTVTPSGTPVSPSADSTITSSVGWFVDTTKNYPIKTMGTLYLGDECAGVATGGKTGVDTTINSDINAVTNIKYSYFDDSRYNEFNNSIVKLAYEYNGVAWIRLDNLLEGVAFHTGVGDVSHQVIYGGIHGSVEISDISVSYPGCDEWESMIRSFGGTWHRKGTTGLDRESRYASFSTIHEDELKNIYYKVGDFRDETNDGILYSSQFLITGSTPELSGAKWSTYVNAISGHVSHIAYAEKHSEHKNLLDITYFIGGESWVGNSIKYEKLNNNNSVLPYAERESALDDTDQVGFITKNNLTKDAYKYVSSYKPDYNANPITSDGIPSFPTSGYYANKENFINIVDEYKYAGHPTDGGMWLWSRPTPGEELFHPSNIHDKPQYYYDSCGIKHISGSWQSYESWINSSFKTNIGLHTAVCWYEKQQCVTLQDSDAEKSADYSLEMETLRNYRWTMGDFRFKSNKLSPGGKNIGCLNMNIASDRELMYTEGYINLYDLISGDTSIIPNSIAYGLSRPYYYAWDLHNANRRVVLCPVDDPIPYYRGFIDTGTSITEIPISGVVVPISSANNVAPSGSWGNYFDYVYEVIDLKTTELGGVFFKNNIMTKSGEGSPIKVDYTSDFFASGLINSSYPSYTVNPLTDLVGFSNKCFTPIDYFNRIWFIPSIPVSACNLTGCSYIGTTNFITAGPSNFIENISTIMTPISSSDVASWLFDIVDSPLFINSQNSLYDKKVQIPNSTCISISGIAPSIIVYYKNGVDFSGALYLNTCATAGISYSCLTDGVSGEFGSTIRTGCASLTGCDNYVNKNTLFLNPCGLFIANCETCRTDGTSADPIRVFYHSGWFDNRADAIYGCAKPDGFYELTTPDACENSCLTFWTSGCHIVATPTTGLFAISGSTSGSSGFYWVHGDGATYTQKGFGFYPNNFSITGCKLQDCSYGIKNNEIYWNFELPQSNDITKLDNLREFFDTLSFGLPASYVKPSKFTYSFYITRDGVGLDQLFYGKKRNTFVERWKFPHTDIVLDALVFNNANPHIILNDGSGDYIPLADSNIFKYGSLSVGEIEYPKINIFPNGLVDSTGVYNSIILMSQVQSDITASRIANYYTSSMLPITASCNFESLRTWLSIKEEENIKDKFSSHYYPMTYDNFDGPISGGPYFLPRGVSHQSQFSIIPTANSSAIRDRSGLWPWCDLLEGKATNKPKIGGATWYWDINGNIWTAETINIETINPKFCYDQRTNTDPLHRKMAQPTIDSIYPTSYSRETYRIRCQDKRGELLVDYKITYDEVAGPEIIGSKEGFDYNIFGTGLKPRSIDLINYNNKPLSGPTQTWVEDFDESNSIHSINWRRTQLLGASGCNKDLYTHHYGTMCEMLSGGYYKNNIKNGEGYFCRIGSDADVWVYSAPIGKIELSFINSNFFIQESPFAINVISQGSSIGMASFTKNVSGQSNCYINGFPPLSAICYSVSADPLSCCYIPGPFGQCLSYDIQSAEYEYRSDVCRIYISSVKTISGNTCVLDQFVDASTMPLSSIGFFSSSNPAPSGFVAPYTALGWISCNQDYQPLGSEIVRSYKYSNGNTDGGIISSAYITGPRSHGLGGLGLAKSNALCGSLLYSGDRAPCQYSQFNNKMNGAIPSDIVIGTSWPWNIIGFDGLLGPTGFTDAIDDVGNYWMAIGDFNNTNPYTDANFVSFNKNSFKNLYTIIKINAFNKADFFRTVLAKTNWKEVSGHNLESTICLSESFNLVNEGVKGTRLREGILETINMQDGDRYYDLYVKLIQENNINVYENAIVKDKVNYTPPTYTTSNSTIEISGSYILPMNPLVGIPNNKVIQKLDLVSQFDINSASCYISTDSMSTLCQSASPWKQHNHEEWIAPYLESPFAGPYSEQGFNIWLTTGNNPRWGVSLWSSITEGKVWANYRRQRIHVNEYREQVVLASLTATISIDDFEALDTSSTDVTGAITHIPVYVNYDEFIYCLGDYKEAPIIKDLLSKQTPNSKNGVDSVDHIIASVNSTYMDNISGVNSIITNVSGSNYISTISPSCSAFNIDLAKSTNEGYVEWVTSFIQEYKKNITIRATPNVKYYFKYNLNTNMDSNTYMDKFGINWNDTIPYQWRRYQDGVGLGGDAPLFNLLDNNNEFACNRLNQWFIGQTAIGIPDKAIIVGGYSIAGDGELHKSHSWWESPTTGITFKWNVGVIQPEDTSNRNYKNRTLSPFWSNGENSGAKSSLGVTVFDVAGSTKVERQGQANFEDGILEYSVIFDDAIPDYLPNKDKYCITLVSSDNVKVWWEDKTAIGFTIKAETSLVGYVDWSIYLEDLIPGTIMDSLDEQSTYEQVQDL